MVEAMAGRQPLYGLIPAAGKGVRARPYTSEMHKGMLPINGKPNIERIICLMRDELNISRIVIATGHLGETIREYFGNGERLGVEITYVENDDLERGWAWSVLLARPHIDGHFCVMLCDESYISSNHRELLSLPYEDSLAVCAGMHVDDAALIRKNYAIETDAGVVTALMEKPKTVINDLMGSGTFLCSPALFPLLEREFINNRSVDFVNLLSEQIRGGQRVRFFELAGTYVNINDRDSLHLARYHDRMRHFSEYKTSLLILSEGDERQIAFTIDRYRELGIFDEIVVCVPQQNSIAQQVVNSDIKLVVCPDHANGFGARIRYAIPHLSGDILVLTEADYSFPNRDVEKLLIYLKEAELVVGTRTTRQLIEQGSTMRGIVRAAHIGLGKLLEFLWWSREGRFTDVGCTFRALWKSTWLQIEPQLQSEGPEILAEMSIASLNQRLRILEVPVNYFNRSQSQNRHYRNAATFFRLFGFIIRKRFD